MDIRARLRAEPELARRLTRKLLATAEAADELAYDGRVSSEVRVIALDESDHAWRLLDRIWRLAYGGAP